MKVCYGSKDLKMKTYKFLVNKGKVRSAHQ